MTTQQKKRTSAMTSFISTLLIVCLVMGTPASLSIAQTNGNNSFTGAGDDLPTPGDEGFDPGDFSDPPGGADDIPYDPNLDGNFDSVPTHSSTLSQRSSRTPGAVVEPNSSTLRKPNQNGRGDTASSGRIPAGNERIESLDFNDAPIEDVIRAISRLTGKNFILDPGVKGRISILAPSSVTVDEAYRAFLSALAINGYTVVPSGKFLKIMPTRTAQKDNIETSTNRQAPSTDQLITRIIQMRHLSVSDVNRYLRTLVSKDGEMIGYEPTNSLILTDYGSNIRRILKILEELDKPGFEERLSVIPIHFARAKDLAATIEKIIARGGRPGGGIPGQRFDTFQSRGLASVRGPSTDASLSLVAPDERTNSLIVLGNQAGIDKVRTLVEELDFSLDAGDGGGVFVYRLRHSIAESVANTLNGLVSKGGAAGTPAPRIGGFPVPRPFEPMPSQTPGGGTQATGPLFGGDVKIVPDKNTNSLIVVGSKQDFDTIRGLLGKIDVPRDQVFVEAIIMEINSEKTKDWNITNYYLDPSSQGVGRAGFSSGSLQNILNPLNDAGLVLGFGRGQEFTARIGDLEVRVPSLLSFIQLLQRHADANILSTPQILAMDNEEAMIEVGDQVPIGVETQTTQAGITTSAPRFDKATIKLTITPNVSPDSSSIRMKVDQSVRQASDATVRAAQLRDIATIISDRTIKTNIVVDDQDTVVLGGLIRDEDRRVETKVPLLGDLPILGWLFKSSNSRKNKINLLVFLTPKILRNSSDSRNLLGRKIDERKSWLQSTLIGEDPFEDRVRAILKNAQAKEQARAAAAAHEPDEKNEPAPTATPTPTPAANPQSPVAAPEAAPLSVPPAEPQREPATENPQAPTPQSESAAPLEATPEPSEAPKAEAPLN